MEFAVAGVMNFSIKNWEADDCSQIPERQTVPEHFRPPQNDHISDRQHFQKVGVPLTNGHPNSGGCGIVRSEETVGEYLEDLKQKGIGHSAETQC
jgi:hypothetical protein